MPYSTWPVAGRRNTMRTSVLARSLLLMLALFAVSAVMAQDVKPTPEVRKVLAPAGKLRVGLYLGNPSSLLKEPVSGPGHWCRI